MNTTTQVVTADQVTVEKPATGMDIAKMIYSRVTANDFVLPEGIKSIRQAFIQAAIDEAGLTKNGASTYYQNLSNAARGKPLYSYTPKRSSIVAEAKEHEAAAEKTLAEAKEILAQAEAIRSPKKTAKKTSAKSSAHA